MSFKDSDLKDTFDIVHKRKLETSSTMQSIFHDLRDNWTPELSIQDVVKWSSKVGNNNILTPVLLMQIKLRKFVMGEKYWLAKTKKRFEDPHQSRVEYIKEFQTIIKNKLADFKKKKQLEKAEKKMKNRNRMGRAEENVARKQSILLDVFKLKGTSAQANNVSNRVIPTSNLADEAKADQKERESNDGKLFQDNSSPTSKKSSRMKSSNELNDNSNTPTRSKKQSSNISTRSNTSNNISTTNLNDSEGATPKSTKSSKSKKKQAQA